MPKIYVLMSWDIEVSKNFSRENLEKEKSDIDTTNCCIIEEKTLESICPMCWSDDYSFDWDTMVCDSCFYLE